MCVLGLVLTAPWAGAWIVLSTTGRAFPGFLGGTSVGAGSPTVPRGPERPHPGLVTSPACFRAQSGPARVPVSPVSAPGPREPSRSQP